MRLRIISIGPKHDPDLKAKIEAYCDRLRSTHPVEWVLVPYSSQDGPSARRRESDAIRAKLAPRELVVLLDERGKPLDSPAFAQRLEEWQSRDRLTFVIGGAYGVDEELRTRADFVWSLSPLVFPHQLVRLLLVEQLYRATCILRSHPYHHA